MALDHDQCNGSPLPSCFHAVLLRAGLFTLVGWLMIRWDSGAPGAVWALVIALAILAAIAGGEIWLYVH